MNHIPGTWTDQDRAPCGYCGSLIKHVNGGGNGWIVCDETGVSYLICWKSPCTSLADVWTCCEYDQVGQTCIECGRLRNPLGV